MMIDSYEYLPRLVPTVDSPELTSHVTQVDIGEAPKGQSTSSSTQYTSWQWFITSHVFVRLTDIRF